MDSVKAEIISIGNEILAGWTLNTNAHWIAQKCNDIGLAVQWISTIADTEDEIKKALNNASARAEVILCTGGLGPTSDDITKKTIASPRRAGAASAQERGPAAYPPCQGRQTGHAAVDHSQTAR